MFFKNFMLVSIAALLIILGVMRVDSADNKNKTKNPRFEITVTQKVTGKDGKLSDVSLGKIVIELYPEIAPKHVHNFDSLVAVKFYDGLAFHRVIPGFMIQGGDPNSKDKPRELWGTGQAGQTRVPAEFNELKHTRGVISMARTNDPNSATSQFFIMHADKTHLDGQYSAFGKVVTGLEVVDKIAAAPRDKRDNPLDKIEMKIVKLK